ncbi:hypothetical protein X801_01389, partial [Opisthorchis viverrini]
MTYSALTLVLHVDHHYVGLGVIVMFLAWFNFLLQMMRLRRFCALVPRTFSCPAVQKNCFGPRGQFEALGNGNSTQTSVTVELQSFQYVGLSLFKTLFMMLGEYEHTATIVEPLTGHSPLSIHYPVITLFFYVGFIFLVPIILMNLLIGLAVGDIEHVRQSSVLRLISQQVYWLADWEPKLMSIFRSKIYSPHWKRKCKRDANVT